MERSIASVLVLVGMAGMAAGTAILSVQFVRFDNPGGKGANGHCCDGKSIFCPSRCDHRFIVCLDRRYGRQDTESCPYGKKSTGEVSDQDSIVFGGKVGGMVNPMTFTLDTWPGEVRIKVGVWDKDDNNDDFVDFLKHDVTTRPARSFATSRRQRVAVRSRVTLQLTVRVYCGPGSYGSSCDVLCTPRNDSTVAYTCDTNTGRKICLEGWTGLGCDVSVDDCQANRCRHGATCRDGHRGYTCDCSPGYQGDFCDDEINECLSNPCQNNGTCHDDVSKFSCTCDSRWTGVTCHVRDACSEITCSNGGTCFNVNSTFVCKCPQGFAGKRCQTDVDECASAPCQNGGTCSDLRGHYACACTPGWRGQDCDVDLDECLSSPCERATRCQNLRNDFACVCVEGWSGKRCDTDIDECLKDPCLNGGTCTNEQPGFSCTCPFGFYGDACENDRDECVMNPCSRGSTCMNVPGTFTCVCAPDFTGPTCQHEIDDCVGQLCEHNGTCLDLTLDFLCACAPQYTGRKCGVYIDRCLAAPCQNGGECRDPGYGKEVECTCTAEWAGRLCQRDVNECLQDPCANGGACQNSAGGFGCRCLDGWTGALCQEDVNECRLLLRDNSSESGAPAVVAPSSDPLAAIEPSRAAAARMSPFDDPSVDSFSDPLALVEPSGDPEEDLESSWCAHKGLCLNADGSFFCVCRQGWSGSRCQDDVDECASSTDGGYGGRGQRQGQDGQGQGQGQPACRHGGQCVNTAGGFTCQCPLAWTGQLCEKDVDECSSGSPTCAGGATCLNTEGSFLCRCPKGWQGHECRQDVDECAAPTPPPSSAHSGGTTTPLPTDASRAGPCRNQATCVNTAGSFSCACAAGWTGATCQDDVNECVEGLVKSAGGRGGDGGATSDDVNTFSSPSQTFNASIPWSTGSTTTRSGVTVGSSPATTAAVGHLNQNPKEPGPEPESEPESACLNGGDCRNGIGSFRCICRKGWTGPRCETDLDECGSGGGVGDGGVLGVSGDGGGGGVGGSVGPCLHGGRCHNSAGGFTCTCGDGWEGPLCAREKNGCEVGKRDGEGKKKEGKGEERRTEEEKPREMEEEEQGPCGHRATACVPRRRGRFTCVCSRGWQGLRCQEDRDECDLDPCENGGTCINREGGFRCLCPKGLEGVTCSNSTAFDLGIVLPFYLRGHFDEEEKVVVTKGIKLFLEEHGGFQHDVNVHAKIQTHELTLPKQIDVTQVSIYVVVENVTLSSEDVTEIFNRVTVNKLQTYLPLPFFTGEVKDHVIPVGNSRQKVGSPFPWLAVVGALVGLVGVVAVTVCLCRHKATVRWRPGKRSDAAVMYSHSRRRFSRTPDGADGEGDHDVTEYVNTALVRDVDLQPLHVGNLPHVDMATARDASPSLDGGSSGYNTLPGETAPALPEGTCCAAATCGEAVADCSLPPKQEPRYSTFPGDAPSPDCPAGRSRPTSTFDDDDVVQDSHHQSPPQQQQEGHYDNLPSDREHFQHRCDVSSTTALCGDDSLFRDVVDDDVKAAGGGSGDCGDGGDGGGCPDDGHYSTLPTRGWRERERGPPPQRAEMRPETGEVPWSRPPPREEVQLRRQGRSSTSRVSCRVEVSDFRSPSPPSASSSLSTSSSFSSSSPRRPLPSSSSSSPPRSRLGSRSGGRETESLSFVNTVYMTIPTAASSALSHAHTTRHPPPPGPSADTATRSPDTSSCLTPAPPMPAPRPVSTYPPDPNRGALPSPPVAGKDARLSSEIARE